MIGQRGPSAGGVSDVPVAHRGVTYAALGEVSGYPAAGELAIVEPHGVLQDAGDPRVGLRSRQRCGDLGCGRLQRASEMACRRSGFRRRLCGRCVASQVVVQHAAYFRRGRGDAFPGGQDDGCRLGTRIGARPCPRAGKDVLDRDAVPGAGDQRYGVGFGLVHAVTAGGRRARRVSDGVVHQDVAELVGERPGGLSAGQTRRDTDAPGGPERSAVTGAAIFPLDREAFPAGEAAQAVPQAGRRLPRRREEGGRERDRRAGGLGQVPDVGDTPGLTPAMVLAGLFSAAAVWLLAARAGEDLDAFFVAVDLASGCPPRLVSPDLGRVWYL